VRFIKILFPDVLKKENQSFSCFRELRKRHKKTEPPAEANDPV